MSSAAEKANLARIRDNQRRSRARRKEYLQELEARLRQCELQGIEASSEIQLAARRVADENKKLRSLLVQRGLGDDSIEAYLHTSPADTLASSYATSNAVQILEQLLQTRKACCTDGNNPAPTNGRAGSRESSSSVGTVSSIWDPAFSQNTEGRGNAPSWQYHGGNATPSAQQFMTPSTSTASRASSVLNLAPASNRGTSQQHQRISPAHNPRNMSPASSHQNHQTMYDFDSQLSNSYPHNQSTAQKHLQPLDTSQSMYTPQQTSSNLNSCNFATDIITGMVGYADSSTIRADLGCLPNGLECEVDNQLVFDVMDRYSGSGL